MLTAEKKKYTAKDYEMLDEGAPFQLINSDLIMSPSPNSYHQLISARIFKMIDQFLGQSKKGGICLYAPLDVHLDDENIVQPDLIYIYEERISELVKERIEGAPDLVIEILSPSTAYYDLRQKKDIYEHYQVLEYIIVDPVQLNAESHVLENNQFVLKQKAQRAGKLDSFVLSGLVFDLEKIF